MVDFEILTDIPVTFFYKGQQYSGRLCKVSGAGCSAAWDLYFGNYYHGALRLTQGKWSFTTQTRIFEDAPAILDYFVNHVILAEG